MFFNILGNIGNLTRKLQKCLFIHVLAESTWSLVLAGARCELFGCIKYLTLLSGKLIAADAFLGCIDETGLLGHEIYIIFVITRARLPFIWDS